MSRGKKTDTPTPADFAKAMNAAQPKRRGRPPKAPAPAPPDNLPIAFPVGLRNEVTFLVTGRPPWLLQHGTRGMVEKKMKEIEDIRQMKEEMSQEDQEKAIYRRQKTLADIELPEESVEFATYPTQDGRFWFPASAFSSAIIDALQTSGAVFPYEQNGKAKTKGAHLVLENSIRVNQTQCILVDQRTLKPFPVPQNGDKPPYIMDVRTVVNVDKGRVLVFRPLWLHWAVFVTVSFDSLLHGPGVVKQAMDLAGDRIGIGAHRPYPPPKSKNPNRGRGGPYGVFTVQVWDKPIPTDCLPEY